MAKNPAQAARQRKWYYAHLEEARAKHREYYRKRAQKQREWQLRTKYGLTHEAWEKMLADQHNACAICGKGFEQYRDALVDHCHETNKIRGLLCFNCNIGIGYLKHSPDKLRNAALYLERDE